jgi:hypothetical protein
MMNLTWSVFSIGAYAHEFTTSLPDPFGIEREKKKGAE